MSTVWVVTREHNEYDQHGEYFVAVYLKKPNFHQLKKLLPDEDDVTIGKLTRGGGRHRYEDVWHNLREVDTDDL